MEWPDHLAPLHRRVRNKLDPSIPASPSLLPRAESWRKIAALSVTSRHVDPHDDLFAFLHGRRHDFREGPVGNAHCHGNTFQLVLIVSFPDRRLSAARLGPTGLPPGDFTLAGRMV